MSLELVQGRDAMEELLDQAIMSSLLVRGGPMEEEIRKVIRCSLPTSVDPNSFPNSPLEEIIVQGVKKLQTCLPWEEQATKVEFVKNVKTILSICLRRPIKSILTPEEWIWIHSIFKFVDHAARYSSGMGRSSAVHPLALLDRWDNVVEFQKKEASEEVSPVPRPRLDHPRILVILFLYLFGYVERSGTKTYNPGSLDFRDIYVSLLLFQGSYVWIMFRDVAIKKVERPRKDGTVTVRYEARFKPTREKAYFHVGTYEDEEDAKAACKIAQFYFGQNLAGTVDLQDGLSFNIPSLTECERRTLSSALSSVSGEAASKVKRDWIKLKTAEVFEVYKETWTANWIDEMIDFNAEEQQPGDQQPNLEEWQLGAGCDRIAEERQQHRATLQQLEQRTLENLELQREVMELRREIVELQQKTEGMGLQGVEHSIEHETAMGISNA